MSYFCLHFLNQKCLQEILILWDLFVAFRPSFQEKKIKKSNSAQVEGKYWMQCPEILPLGEETKGSCKYSFDASRRRENELLGRGG